MKPEHTLESQPASLRRTEVAIIGAGIVGLFNALQFAKRGFQVTIIDDVVGQKRSYKVGESLLIFSNMFLRTIGGLDDFLQRESIPKSGVWFTYGAEGTTNFEGTTEWALERTLAKEWKEAFASERLYRATVEDAQIVRPEAEDEMAQQVHAHPNVTFLDTAKVKDIRIDKEGQLHDISWVSRSTGTAGTLQTNWVIDCSGRARLLAKRLNHTVEDLELADGFKTTAVWAQFSGIRKEMFGQNWAYQFADGKTAKRETTTVHLWGDGYWIWVINLSKERISIGVTYNQKNPPPGANYEEQFWNVLRRYPVFDEVLKKENVIELRVYKNVQHMTDTFVSRHRYGMAGDASSIIDAYYSQGMSHSFLTSWHITNIVEEDLRQGRLNLPYIDRVNEALRADWRMIRNMVRGKFTPAIADSRFFLLTHILDMILFIAVGIPRYHLTRWLVETEGSSAKERPLHRKLRRYAARRCFYSRSFPLLSPRMAEAAQRYLHGVITRRALWRLAHGVRVPRVKSIVRYAVVGIPVWRIFGKPADSLVDISPNEVKKTPKFLLFTGTQRFPFTLVLANALTIATFFGLFAYDWVTTSWAKLTDVFRSRAQEHRSDRVPGDRDGLSPNAVRATAPPE